jgi:hypothetical protein
MLQMQHFIDLFLKFRTNLRVRRVLALLNAALVAAILDLISRADFRLAKYKQYQ